jgi:hypothetical protein
MKRSTWIRPLVLGALWLGLVLAAVPRAPAVEQAWEFLEGLRGRGYFDTALTYLEEMEKSPLCPADLKEVIDYEAGVTLISASRTGSVQVRESQLDQARNRLEKFVKEHAQHKLAADANIQLANVLVERGRIKAELARGATKTPEEKKALMEEARKQYEAARKVFAEAEARYLDEAKKLHEAKDSDQVEARDEARRNLVQARLFLAGVIYEIGKTYEPDTDEHKANLTESAKQYHDLYEKYGSYVAGLYARMWEGRIFKELGQTEKAVNIFKEMRTLPAEAPPFRMLINQSTALALETYLLPKEKKYQDAVTMSAEWEKNAQPQEMNDEHGLKIQYLAAVANMELAKAAEDDRTRRGFVKEARERLDFVRRFPGEYRSQAIEKLRDELFGKTDTTPGDLIDFADARDKGDFAWTAFVTTYGKLQQAKTAKEQQELNEQIAELRQQTLKFYRASLEFAADEEVQIDLLNLIRFRMTFLYFLGQDYYRAAVLGEFLARKHPNSVGARKGAEIAVKCYRSLYTEAGPADDTGFEVGHMEGIANYITTRWEGAPEADEAWMMLTDTMVDENELARALECLGHISEESPRRAQAELRTGQSLWAAYVRLANKPEDLRPPQDKLDILLGKAQETLQQGIERRRKAVQDGSEKVDYALLYSVLSLAQIHVGAGRAAEAATWLDDADLGPVTFVKKDDPAAADGNFREDVYKTALRAYVGAQKLDEAEDVMKALEEVATDRKRLTQIYIKLGRELEEQLGRLENPEDRRRVSQGFQVFLDRIRNRSEGNTFSSLHWVAETYFGLADGLAAGRDDLPPEAKGFYEDARDTYKKILDGIEDKSLADAPAGAAMAINVRLAACLRALGDYEEALKLLKEILRENDRRVDVQIEAAKTYQAQGRERPACYELAIVGAADGGKRLIWGWGGIANKVYAFDKYRDQFHRARYNLAVCRKDFALTKKGADRTRTLEQAELDIVRVYQLYPEMGGPEWYEKYDDLLKTIQKLLKRKQADGLAGLN